MSSGDQSFFASKKWKNIMKYVYGLGAAVVIVGALFKIMHWPGSGILLTVGLLTEAGIFIMSVMEPVHEDLHWELVYPELAGVTSEDGEVAIEEDQTEIQRLTNMLEEAQIDKALIDKLGDGMRNLGENAAQLKSTTSAISATDGYVSSLQDASENVNMLSDAYSRASDKIANLTETAGDSESVGEQMNKVSKNLSALNNVYELQLQGSSAHLEATEKFQSQVTEMMDNLAASSENTRLYKENMEVMSKNLSDLNNIYGNMLRSMKGE